MKKQLIAAFLLLALSVAGLGGAHVALSGDARQVTWESRPLLGDPAAVSELNITMRHNEWNHLFWESRIDPSGAGEVDFRFCAGKPAYQTEPHYAIRFDSGLYSSITWVGQFSMTEDVVKRKPELRPALDVASRAPEQGSYTETVRYGDYFDILTPEVDLSLPGGNLDMSMSQALDPETYGADPQRVRIVTQLAEAFRFPVPEDFCVEVNVFKEDGLVKDVSMNEHGEDYLSIEWDNLVAGDYIYFTVSGSRGWTEEGEPRLLDHSLHPAGCRALYRLPTEDRPLSITDLEVVLPLEPEETILALNADPDNSHVMAVIGKDDREKVCVLNNATGRMELEADCGSYSVENFGLGGGLLTWKDLALYTNGDRLFLLQEQNGTYRVAMTGPIPEEIGSWSERSSMRYFQAAYDGGRLAIGTVLDTRLGPEPPVDGRNGTADLGLLVYEGSQPVYAGELSPSLSRGNYVRADNNPIELSW